MLFGLLAILGLFSGMFLFYFTKDEFKQGKIYFKLLEILILLSIIAITIFYDFNYLLFIFGIILGFFIREFYFYFGILIVSIKEINYNFLVSSLVFLFGLPYGTLISKKDYNKIILNIILFFIPIILYFFNFNLISFASGALTSLILLEINSLINLKLKH